MIETHFNIGGRQFGDFQLARKRAEMQGHDTLASGGGLIAFALSIGLSTVEQLHHYGHLPTWSRAQFLPPVAISPAFEQGFLEEHASR